MLQENLLRRKYNESLHNEPNPVATSPESCHFEFPDADLPKHNQVIVDTSVRVDHLRTGNRYLEKLLLDAEVVCHEFIIGELACGNLKNRTEILTLLQSLPHSKTVDPQEFLYFIDKHCLMGRGIGFVDVHLLASAQLSSLTIWTADKSLMSAAKNLKLQYSKK